jgi:hypothetical protein
MSPLLETITSSVGQTNKLLIILLKASIIREEDPDPLEAAASDRCNFLLL